MKKPVVFPGLSLQKKIPLLICILLVCTVAIFTYSSYQEVRKVSLASGSSRLHALTEQIGSMFEQMGRQMLTATQKTANDPAVLAYLRSGGRDSGEQVKSLLRQGQTDSLMPLVQLLNMERQALLESGDSRMFLTMIDSALPAARVGSSVTQVGRVFTRNTKMYFPIIVTVTDGKEVLGYLVKWRRLITTPAEIEALSKLMGANSAFYIGNDDGKFWTNGLVTIPSPPLNLKDLTKVVHYSYGETPVMASAKAVTNTKWLVMITLSEDAITATADQFLYQMIAVGAGLTLLCIFFAWLIGRSITSPLLKLTHFAEAMANGNYSHRLNIQRKDELGKLANAFDTMSVKRKKYEEELRFSQEQLRQLAAHLQNIRDEERVGIAREIHDVIGQLLTAIKFDVHWLKRKLVPVNTETERKITGTLQLVDETIQATRKISSDLRPDILNDLGLIEALRWQTNEFQTRTGILCHFSASQQQPQMTNTVAFGLFRICQEALTNIARHADASMVSVIFEQDHVNRCFVLRITDNGDGFDPEAARQKKRLGLVGMKERVLSMNGECVFETAPGKGVMVSVRVPM